MKSSFFKNKFVLYLPKILLTGEGGIGADSVTRLDLARTSTLRYLEYSASRQSSLPKTMTVNRLQQTIYCTKVGHIRSCSTRFLFCVSQAPQKIYESPTARPVHDTSCVLFGGVRNTSNKFGVLVGLATAVVQTQR